MDEHIAGKQETDSPEIPLNARELRGVQQGVAAMIMPVGGGWKVQYLTGLDFEEEHGRTFSTLAAAVDAITELLPIVNSEEGRARARDMEELLWSRLHDDLREEGQ